MYESLFFKWPRYVFLLILLFGIAPIPLLAQTVTIPQSTRDRIAIECRRQHPSLFADYLSRQACINERERLALGMINEEQQELDRRVRHYQAAQRRSDAIRNKLIITNPNLECPSGNNCEAYRVTVSVKNTSNEIVREIWFGFVFVPPAENCPADLSARVRRYFTLHPGETGTFRWSGYEAGMPLPPRSRPLRFCTSIAGVDLG